MCADARTEIMLLGGFLDESLPDAIKKMGFGLTSEDSIVNAVLAASKDTLIIIDLRCNGAAELATIRSSPLSKCRGIIGICAGEQDQRQFSAFVTDILPAPIDFNSLYESICCVGSTLNSGSIGLWESHAQSECKSPESTQSAAFQSNKRPLVVSDFAKPSEKRLHVDKLADRCRDSISLASTPRLSMTCSGAIAKARPQSDLVSARQTSAGVAPSPTSALVN